VGIRIGHQKAEGLRAGGKSILIKASHINRREWGEEKGVMLMN